MAVLELGYLAANRGVTFGQPQRQASICDCCASTYEPADYSTFYGINVSLSSPGPTDGRETDEVTLPSGDKLYITISTEPFEGGDDDDDY